MDKDGKDHTVLAPIGKNLLELAHENDVDLEGVWGMAIMMGWGAHGEGWAARWEQGRGTSPSLHHKQGNVRSAAPPNPPTQAHASARWRVPRATSS